MGVAEASLFFVVPDLLLSWVAMNRGLKVAAFAPAALPVRLPRFLLAAACFALIGRALKDRIDRRILLAAFTSGWLLFYLWFWLAHPG